MNWRRGRSSRSDTRVAVRGKSRAKRERVTDRNEEIVMHRKTIDRAAVLLGALVSVPLGAQQTTVLRASRLIDGTRAAPIQNAALVVTDDHLVASGPAATTPAPAAARAPALRDLTLLPGFIAAHT